MKQKFIYGCLAATLTMGMMSCSNFLEENPQDKMPEEEAYKTSELIYLNTVANIYTQIKHLGGTDRNVYDMQTITNDECMIPTRGSDWDDGGLWRRLYSHTWDKAEGPFKTAWEDLYKVITLCNQSIAKQDELIALNPENKDIPAYQAELRAVRAMYYYYLMDLFGRVPLVITKDAQISSVKQSERSEIFKFVREELQAVLPLLSDAKSAQAGLYYGRITKGVAYFLLTKLALNAPVYSDNDWTDNEGRPNGSTDFPVDGKPTLCWDAAIAYADAVKALGYQLENDFSFNFSVTNETSRENIFTLPSDPTLYDVNFLMLNRTLHYAHSQAYTINGWNGMCATKETFHIFKASPNDERLEKTFFTGQAYGPTGEKVQDNGVDLIYDPEAVQLHFTGTEPAMKVAGARFAKYEIDQASTGAGSKVHNDYVLFRYADVILMKAEAKLRKGENADAEINEVRQRASADPIQDATLDNLLDERMLELAWEGVRRQDLIRFGQFTKPISDRPASAPFRTVFPIPADVVLLNTNLVQNPGY